LEKNFIGRDAKMLLNIISGNVLNIHPPNGEMKRIQGMVERIGERTIAVENYGVLMLHSFPKKQK
jgi:hypothetical protein